MGLPSEIDELPEHLAPLTDLQLAFVVKFVHEGLAQTEAAIEAGYAPDSAHVAASRLMRNPKVFNAIQVEAMRNLGALGPSAVRQIGKLIDGAKSEYVRLEAAKDVLNRLGFSRSDGSGQTQPVKVVINLGNGG